MIEYQTPVSGLCVFADFAKGSQDYAHSLFGVRYYFGKRKDLKLRHREDDPQNIMTSVINNIGTYGAEYNKKAKQYNKNAKEYNEALRADPDMTFEMFNTLSLPIYDDSSYGFTITYNPEFLPE